MPDYKHQLVKVVWDDAEDPDEGATWLDDEDVEKFAGTVTLVQSVGFVRSYTTKYITLTADYIERLGHHGRATKIPVSAVQTIERLETVKEGE